MHGLRTFVSLVSGLAAGLMGGCIDVPQAGAFDLHEEVVQARTEPLLPDESVRQTSVPPVADPSVVAARAPTSVGPRVVVSAYGKSRESERCPFTVETQGLPAVSSDGARAVSGWIDSSADETDSLHVRWHDVETDAVVESLRVYDGYGDFDENSSCRRWWQQIRHAASEVNARLAEETWRPMSELPIAIHDPWDVHGHDPETRAEELARPPAERPVEMMWWWGDVVVRIPGVRVLARVPVRWYGQDPDRFCQSAPRLQEVFADEETGVAAVLLDYESGACLCWTSSSMRMLRLPPEVFSAVRNQTPTNEP